MLCVQNKKFLYSVMDDLVSGKRVFISSSHVQEVFDVAKAWIGFDNWKAKMCSVASCCYCWCTSDHPVDMDISFFLRLITELTTKVSWI
jgi:hypothetical protein